MGGFLGGDTAGGTSSQQTTFLPGQAAAFSNLIAAGQTRAFAPESQVAGFTPAQQAGQRQLIGAAGSLQPQIANAQNTLGFLLDPSLSDPSSNPALQGTIEAGQRDIFRNLQEQTLPAVAGQAAGTGQSSSSRQGIAEGIAARGALDTSSDVTANILNNAFNTGLQTNVQALGLAPQTLGLSTLPGQILTGVGGQQQAQQQRELSEADARLQQLSALISGIPPSGSSGATGVSGGGGGAFNQMLGLFLTALPFFGGGGGGNQAANFQGNAFPFSQSNPTSF